MKIDARYRFAAVADAIQTKLIENYNFDRRSFGQSVSRCELITDIQMVPGVLAVDLDAPELAEVTAKHDELLVINPHMIQLSQWL